MKNSINANDRTTRSEEAAEKLIALILSRNLQGGEKLPNEQELCRFLNISRSTLREAVKQLSIRNILDVRQGSGTYVSFSRGIPTDPLGLTFLDRNDNLAIDLIDARIVLEPSIAMRAATKATEEDIRRLIQLRDLHKSAIHSNEDYQETDTQFHAHLAKCSGNAIFTNLVSIMASSIQFSTIITSAEYRETSVKYHHIITDCVARRDPVGAYNAMLAHLNVSREHYIRMRDGNQ